jgi:eukaryotic-like serine/threonine-protein kinase
VTAPHLGAGHAVAGNYTIRALLGFTGEAATYQAVSGAGQEVVIKLYDPALGQRADVMGELERVRGQVAALPQGGVVPVIDGGYDVGTGAPFVVTEYLQSESLATMVSSGTLNASMLAHVLSGVAQLLDQGCNLQLHHLALKPTNIFVGPAPQYQVRITDFGASVVRRASPTHEAYALGAPWWAPEQLQPAAHLGAATDTFSAALVAFYALTGRSYWRSCQQHPPDLAAWQAEVMGERAPVSHRARELGVVVNPIVDAIFARALSVNQAERPQSVAEIAQVLASTVAAPPREEARTMAFPEGSFPDLDPAAAAGYGAAPQPAAPAVASPPGAGAAAAQPYGAPPATAAPGEEAGVTPGLPPFRPDKPKKTEKSKTPIIIGVVAAVLLGGSALAFFALGGDDETGGPTTVAAGGSKPVGDGAGGSEPASTSSATGEGGAASGEGGAPVDEPPTIKATLRCKPTCDDLFIDNEKIDEKGDPLELVPGKHTVKAIKAGYVTITKSFQVPTEGPFDKEFVLQRIAPASKKGAGPCSNQFLPCNK